MKKYENTIAVAALLLLLLLFALFLFDGTAVFVTWFPYLFGLGMLCIATVSCLRGASNKAWLAKHKGIFFTATSLVLAASTALIVYAATSLTVTQHQYKTVDGIPVTLTVSASDSANDKAQGKVSINSSGVITVTAKEDDCDFKTQTVTVIVRNDSDCAISFLLSYSSTDSNMTCVKGNSSVASGTVVELAKAESLTFALASGTNSDKTSNVSRTGTITISNLVFVRDGSTQVTNFKAGAHGSYTVNGEAVTADTSKNLANDQAFTLVPQPEEGYELYAWLTEKRGLWFENSFLVTPGVTEMIQPIFKRIGSAVYSVGNSYYVFLDTAIAAAGESGTVVLFASGTAFASNGSSEFDITIPAGVTLLIPYDSAGTVSSSGDSIKGLSQAGVSSFIDTHGAHNKVFRTLILAPGAKITCKGTINVNGQRQIGGQPYTGTAAGWYGKLVLGTESTNATVPTTTTQFASIEKQLVIESGGKLRCYGYITGSGGVEVQSGGESRELLQICDWPGGGNATDWEGHKTDDVKDSTGFLLSQYYVQNIEAPLFVQGGATCVAEAVLSLSGIDLEQSVDFIGSGKGLLQLQTGSQLVRIYDVAKDRVNYHCTGAFAIGNINVTISNGFLGMGAVSINSKDYILPFPQNMSIYLKSGAEGSTSNDFSLLPGSELIVEEGAKLTCTGTIYLWDHGNWGYRFFGRAGIDQNRGHTWSNKSPKSAILPYVATLNRASPNATASCGYSGLVRGSSTNTKTGEVTEYYYVVTDNEKFNVHGKLQVDGTLILTGNLRVTSSKRATVTGKGVFTYTPNGTYKALTASYTTTAITTADGVGKIYNATGSATATTAFATAIYYSNGTAWYTHRVVFEGYSGNTVYYTPGSNILPSSYTKPALSGTVEDDKYVYNKAWVQSGDMKAGTATASPYFLMKVGNGTKTQMKSALNLQYRLDDYIWMNAIVTIPAYADGMVELDENYGDTLFLVSANDGKGTYYLVRKVIAKELTSEFKVTLSINGIKTVELDLSFQTFANSLPANHKHKSLVDKIWQYGEAAKAYFEYKALVDAGESTAGIAKPSEVLPLPGDVLNELNSKDKYFNTDTAFGYYLYTQGANILFEERLALIVNFKLVANGDKDKTAVDLKTLFSGDNLVKVGLLAKESSGDFDKDPVLSFSTADVTSYVMYGKHDTTLNPSNPDYGAGEDEELALGERDLANMSISFDLTGGDYLSRFQFRPYVIYKDANGNEQILYGRQFNYGLEDYIARQYKTSDAVGQQLLNNLLVTTWNYANAAANAFPE